MSGVVLNATPNVFVAPDDALAKLIAIVPTARREFWQQDRVTAFFHVYRPRKNRVVLLTAGLRDTPDRTVFEQWDSLGAEVFVKNRSFEYRLELPIDMLARGPYILTLEALANGRSARQVVRFLRQ